MLILRMVQGAGLAMEIPSTMTMMTVATRQETRGGAMGVYTTFRKVGLAVGPVVALMLGRLIFQIPLGHSSDKHGRKPFILWGLILLAPATAVLGVVTDIWNFQELVLCRELHRRPSSRRLWRSLRTCQKKGAKAVKPVW